MKDLKKEARIKAQLNKLLNQLGMDWGILTCAKRGETIWSVHLSDEIDFEFVEKLHRKFWEGCPISLETPISIIGEKEIKA